MLHLKLYPESSMQGPKLTFGAVVSYSMLFSVERFHLMMSMSQRCSAKSNLASSLFRTTSTNQLSAFLSIACKWIL
ncbi:hypothetical protein MTO96_023922 [Rhipicephalus appendiculatus]